MTKGLGRPRHQIQQARTTLGGTFGKSSGPTSGTIGLWSSAGPGITSRRTRPSGSGIDRESSPQHHCRQMPVLRLIGATLVVALVRAGNRGSDERGHPQGVPLRFSGGNQSQLERIHSSPFRARCSSDGNMRRQMQVAAASSGIACPKASMTSQPAYRTSLRVSKVSCQRT